MQVADHFREKVDRAVQRIRKELYTIHKLALYSSPIDYDGRINLAWFQPSSSLSKLDPFVVIEDVVQIMRQCSDGSK